MMKKNDKHNPTIQEALNKFYADDQRIRKLGVDKEDGTALRECLSEKVISEMVEEIKKNREFIDTLTPLQSTFYSNFIGLSDFREFFNNTSNSINALYGFFDTLNISNNKNRMLYLINYYANKLNEHRINEYKTIKFINYMEIIFNIIRCIKFKYQNEDEDIFMDYYFDEFFKIKYILDDIDISKEDFSNIISGLLCNASKAESVTFNKVGSFIFNIEKHDFYNIIILPIITGLKVIHESYKEQMNHLVNYHESK